MMINVSTVLVLAENWRVRNGHFPSQATFRQKENGQEAKVLIRSVCFTF